ncbi:MAG TPA: 3'-5' exonuclease [Pirellulaceae bacterium]|jgi:inhibitor of KinA sporulation pathway (predicted exonuclease)|nr:3'-5' exonuclease [Pirellulaceae bacterium]
MRYVVVDLEATCWENVRIPGRNEIIEIGAVELLSSQGPPSREFARFVRPVAEPELSDFCTRLTSIRQKDVDSADLFGSVFFDFVDWVGDEPFILCSWGAYDLNQFRVDCARHGIPLPPAFERHVNLKTAFASAFGVKSCGMARALEYTGLAMRGTHHRGIDDARNIAALAMLFLPSLEAAGLVPAEKV